MSRNPRQADYAHWNRFPVLDFHQCAMLLLGLEPDQQIEKQSIRRRYDRLWDLIESSRSAGALKGRQPYLQDIEPSKFIEWAKSMGEPIPMDWRPTGVNTGHAAKQTDKTVLKTDSLGEERYEEAVRAAIEMFGNSRRPKHINNDLIPYIQQFPSKYVNCNGTGISDSSLARSIRKGGLESCGISNPLADPRYLDALNKSEE